MSSLMTSRSRSPRRFNYNPQVDSQTIMTFDHKEGCFKMYQEEKHKQATAEANAFDDMINQNKDMTPTANKHEHADHAEEDMDQSKVIFTDICQNPDNNYMQWRYEYTGMKHKDVANYFIWWVKHPEKASWYTNIKTTEESHLWIEYDHFWQYASIAETLDDLIMAIRATYI